MNELFFYTPFNVSIRLNSLECIAEWDASGHSEPYLWPAFLKADATTIPGSSAPIEFQVPFEDQTGRGLLGDAGNDVRAGDVIPIPEQLGRFDTKVESYKFPVGGAELMLAGFVVVLLESDGGPADAMRAGHSAFGQSLRDEVNEFATANLRFPTDEEIQDIKDTVSEDVKDAIKDKYSWYEGLFSERDDLIGFLGGADTVFQAARIRALAKQGPQEFRDPIRKKELIVTSVFPLTYLVHEHHYDLHWEIEVQPEELKLAPIEHKLAEKVEDAAKRLQQLDEIIGALVKKLAEADDRERLDLVTKLEDDVKLKRAELVHELGTAWEEFAKVRRRDNSD